MDKGLSEKLLIGHLSRFVLPATTPGELLFAQNERKRLKLHLRKLQACASELVALRECPHLASQLRSSTFEAQLLSYEEVVRKRLKTSISEVSAKGESGLRDDSQLRLLALRIKRVTGQNSWTALAAVASAAMTARYPGIVEEFDLRTVKKIVSRIAAKTIF